MKLVIILRIYFLGPGKMRVPYSDRSVRPGVKTEMVKSILQCQCVIYSPNLYQLFILTWSTDATRWFTTLTFHAWVTMVRKKRLSLYYSTYQCYIHQTYANCSSWHDQQMPHDGLCAWPTFHAWVTMVWKKWLSLYNSIYGWYIHQTYTNCSSWHDLLMPCVGLCPWPNFTFRLPSHKNDLFDLPFPFDIRATNLLLQTGIPVIETVVKRTWLIHLFGIQIISSEINLMIRKIRPAVKMTFDD